MYTSCRSRLAFEPLGIPITFLPPHRPAIRARRPPTRQNGGEGGFGVADDVADEVKNEETPKERIDRGLGGLLQGLRVAVVGVQGLFAFLLTVPFSARVAPA